MKVYLPNDSQMGIGGGWTFWRNFIKFAPKFGMEIVDSSDADVALICGATMVKRETVSQIKCPVVLRVDGYPEDWRNRGTGIPRLVDFAKRADGIVFQSKFTARTVGEFLRQNNAIPSNKLVTLIINGVDKSIFSPSGLRQERDAGMIYIHMNYRKDPNKRYEEVIMRFRELWLCNKNISLWLIGRYPTEYKEWNFGFFNGERIKYWGVVEDEEMKASILRSGDFFIYPSFADPCPNALIEALACGLEPLYISDYSGAKEIVDLWRHRYDFSAERMVKNYYEFFKEVIGNEKKS